MIQPTPAGQFKYRVTLQRRDTTAKNELGETVPVMEAIADVWAVVKPLSSEEILRNAQNSLDVSHEVRLRYTDAITHADSLLFNGRTLEIASILDLEEWHIEQVLLTKEIQ
jgi:SPP1 family predicted phage head-tail adaptor